MEFGFLDTAEWWAAAGLHVVGDSTQVVWFVCRNIETEETVIDKPTVMETTESSLSVRCSGDG